MIDINEFKKSFEDLANPAQTGDSFGPDQFNRELPIAVISAVRRHLGLPESYNPQVPQPAIAYEKTQMITDELMELKETIMLSVDVNGFATLPGNYFYPSSLNYRQQLKKGSLDNGKVLSTTECCVQNFNLKPTSPYYSKVRAIDIVNDNEFNLILQSELTPPSLSYPKCRIASGGRLEFAPTNLQAVKFTYIRYPKKAFWNYTVANPPVFNPANSQNIELPESMTDTLRFMMLQRLGIPMREKETFQYGQMMKQAGA